MQPVADSIWQQIEADRAPDRSKAYRPSGVVGVFGKWGTGKTHLLNILGRQIVKDAQKNNKPYLVCCFRAWEYEAEGDLAPALIRALVTETNYPWKQFKAGQGPIKPAGGFWPDLKSLRNYAWEFADLVFELGKLSQAPGASIISSIGQRLLKVKDTENDKEAPPPVADQVRERMKELITKITPDGGRLIVLVDDLDRCSPPNIVRLFEWFKNHIDSQACTFVVGLDHRMAAKAIVGHYKGHTLFSGNDGEDYGFRYLDKLFELDYEILPSNTAQQMAMDRNEMDGADLCDWTRTMIKADFGGVADLNRLLEIPAMWIPRVILRTTRTYKLAIEALIKPFSEDPTRVAGDLSRSYPFWLFLISSMHHLFAPDRVENFVGSDLKDAMQKEGMGSLLAGGTKFDSTDPRQRYIEQLNWLKIEPLTEDQMRYLYRMVREKTPRSFRNPDADDPAQQGT
ncbi:MAG: hypothetical protein HND57_17010 [Planctomycetes bacterium]|nr:hypothetical protein [Planctomycetota bacterium]